MLIMLGVLMALPAIAATYLAMSGELLMIKSNCWDPSLGMARFPTGKRRAARWLSGD